MAFPRCVKYRDAIHGASSYYKYGASFRRMMEGMWGWKSLLLACTLSAPAHGGDVLIRNVTVVDVKTGAELPRQSVLIHGDRIAAVGAQVGGAHAATIVNGTGK